MHAITSNVDVKQSVFHAHTNDESQKCMGIFFLKGDINVGFEIVNLF